MCWKEYAETVGAVCVLRRAVTWAFDAALLGSVPVRPLRFRFKYPLGKDAGIGPMSCAAVCGNGRVLRELASAKADVNERVPFTIDELFLQKGTAL